VCFFPSPPQSHFWWCRLKTVGLSSLFAPPRNLHGTRPTGSAVPDCPCPLPLLLLMSNQSVFPICGLQTSGHFFENILRYPSLLIHHLFFKILFLSGAPIYTIFPVSLDPTSPEKFWHGPCPFCIDGSVTISFFQEFPSVPKFLFSPL